MQQGTGTIAQDLVLIGGGHSHALVLRMWGMKPLPGVRLILITDVSETPYSGMLPGHVAGFYSREECHINLRSLAQFAGAVLILDRAIGLDLAENRVLCENHPPIAFDLLSIDIGSTPEIPLWVEANPAMVGAKPVPQFLQWWDHLCDQVQQSPEKPISLGIIGGGTGGVELALNMQQRLTQQLQAQSLQIHLFHRDRELMPSHNAWVRQHFDRLLRERNIQLHLDEQVKDFHHRQVICESGLEIPCDAAVWVTRATAPDWLGRSGLAVDDRGFIQVDQSLRSLSHPNIFAAGDIASMVDYPRPKAGVFAVRQGKPLFENLRHALRQEPLKPYIPQTNYLSLIGTGDRSAVASRGSLGWASPILWRWKDWIDRRFMQRFSNLPTMETASDPATSPDTNPEILTMRCAGCGAKVGSDTLSRVFDRLRSEIANTHPEILIGLDRPDDAAVIRVPAGQVLVQTIDFFPALISDPFVFGQIVTNHALSDLFAMGATAQSVLALATIPYGSETKQAEILYQLLSGALQQLAQSNTQLVGGHTIEGEKLAFGLACNGFGNPEKLLTKGGMQPGNVLILTKPIGTGTLFAADMRRQAQASWIDRAIETMLISNYTASQIFLAHQATACTDITGFGLMGHLVEMVKASQTIAVDINLTAIPWLPGARSATQQGITSSLYPQNLQARHWISNLAEVATHPDFPLLFDPQTAGGLLATVPADRAEACCQALHKAGYTSSAVIGSVSPKVSDLPPITIRSTIQ